MNREQMIWRRPPPDERRRQVADDLRRTIGFLGTITAEARHLDLPVPANMAEILASLEQWRQQVTPSSES
jgi:hypothetical protein